MTPDTLTEQSSRFIAEILQTLKSTNQYEKVLHLIVDRIVRMYKCQTCAVVLIDQNTEYLRIDNFHGLSLTFCNAFRRRLATASIGELLWIGRPIVITDSAASPQRAEEVRLEHPFGSCLCIQISVDHRTLGYLHVDSKERNALSTSDIRLLQPFADIAGIAIFKAQLFEENLRLDKVDRETGVEKYGPFLEKLHASMERAKDFNENFSVMILDIDNFKDTVNTYGYDASRQLMREMGEKVRRHLRNIDAAGKYGFDEFIILLANTDLEYAINSARGLRREIEEALFTSRKIKSTVSIGVAAYPQNGRETEDILLTAKKALFEAQRAGRNNVLALKSEWYAKEMEPFPF